jgi:hypothetical protein
MENFRYLVGKSVKMYNPLEAGRKSVVLDDDTPKKHKHDRRRCPRSGLR